MNPRLLRLRRMAPKDLPVTLSDDQLAGLTAEGVDAAFEMLVLRYRRALNHECRRLVGAADAEEAVQEALLRAYLALAGGSEVRRVAPWLRAIAHNTALNLRQERSTRPPVAREPWQEPQVEVDEFERREKLRMIVEALRSLPDRQREALLMRELEGRSYADIEIRLSASNGAVRQLLNRARAGLRARAAGLAGFEPLLRWMLGNGRAGSGALRLGALSGGCAVTVKICAAALLPAGRLPARAPAAAIDHGATAARRLSLCGRRLVRPRGHRRRPWPPASGPGRDRRGATAAHLNSNGP